MGGVGGGVVQRVLQLLDREASVSRELEVKCKCVRVTPLGWKVQMHSKEVKGS